jgi:hypothetical protein
MFWSKKSGMLYMLWVGITISVLLVINTWLLSQFLTINREILASISEKRVEQLIRFVVPIAMIFVEFWAFDWLQDMTSESPKKVRKAGS